MKKLLSLIIAAVMLASLLPAAQSAAGITINLDGGRVDGFSELFHTWAYSWTEQEAVAVVSGETTRIKLLLNE